MLLQSRDLQLIIARTGDAHGFDLLLVWGILGWNTKNGVYAKLAQFDHLIAGVQPRAPGITFPSSGTTSRAHQYEDSRRLWRVLQASTDLLGRPGRWQQDRRELETGQARACAIVFK
jgi:hypothetical protein